MITRRDFLTAMILFGLAPNAFAYPISKILGPAKPEYIQAYFERMWTWYNREFAPIEKSLSKPERDLLAAWKLHLTTWGLDLARHQMFEHFLFSHRVEEGRLNSARFAFGLSQWPTSLRGKVRSVANHRGIPSSALDSFYGFGWDFAKNEIKVYRLHTGHEKIADNDLQAWSIAHPEGADEPWLGRRVSGMTFVDGKLKKKKLIVPMSRLEGSPFASGSPFDIVSAMKILESGGGTRWHFRLRSFFFPLVDPAVHPALSKHSREFQQVANSLIFENSNHYTFYYP